jgi:hypothetical protein
MCGGVQSNDDDDEYCVHGSFCSETLSEFAAVPKLGPTLGRGEQSSPWSLPAVTCARQQYRRGNVYADAGNENAEDEI